MEPLSSCHYRTRQRRVSGRSALLQSAGAAPWFSSCTFPLEAGYWRGTLDRRIGRRIREARMASVETDLSYLRDAYLRAQHATVLAVDGERVALDSTVFYPTGGGQPHDTGTLSWGDET